MKRALVLFVLGACGDNTLARDAHQARSGERIALLVYAYSDGAKQWDPTTFFDRERQERCGVRQWSDGNRYCTPAAVPAVYSNPNCVDGELGRWLTTLPVPTHFFREYTVGGAELVSRVFVRMEEVAPPATTYEFSNGECVQTAPAGWTYYALGEPLASSRFVRMRQRSSAGKSRLGLDAYTTDDGLYVPIQTDAPLLHDRTLVGTCEVVTRPNAESTTCEPVDAAKAEFSRDAECATDDILLLESETELPEVILRDNAGCHSFARRGIEIPHVPVFYSFGDACVSVIPPVTARMFEVGIPFEAPVLTRTHERDSMHRLQRILLGDGTTTVLDTLLYDSELDVDCVRTEIGDTIRCLPANTLASVLPYFSDAACTVPIELSLVERGACDATTKFAIDQRGEVPSVRPIVAPYTSPIYEISTADTCFQYVPPPREQAYTLDAALPLDRFVDAHVVIE